MVALSHQSVCAKQSVVVIIPKATADLVEVDRRVLLMAVVRDDQHLDSTGKL